MRPSVPDAEDCGCTGTLQGTPSDFQRPNFQRDTRHAALDLPIAGSPISWEVKRDEGWS
jgi:hypothetical protein